MVRSNWIVLFYSGPIRKFQIQTSILQNFCKIGFHKVVLIGIQLEICDILLPIIYSMTLNSYNREIDIY